MSISKDSVSLSDLVTFVRGIVRYNVHKGTGIKGVLGPHMHKLPRLNLKPVSDYKEWRILGEALSQVGVENVPYKAGDIDYDSRAINRNQYDEVSTKFLHGMIRYVGFLYNQKKSTHEALEEAINRVHSKST